MRFHIPFELTTLFTSRIDRIKLEKQTQFPEAFAPKLSMCKHFKFQCKDGPFLPFFLKFQKTTFFFNTHISRDTGQNMAPEQTKVDPKAYRDAIEELYNNKDPIATVARRFSVPTRHLCKAMEDLEAINKIREMSNQSRLIENSERMQVYRWATKYASPSLGTTSTVFEKHDALLLYVQGHKLIDIFKEYGGGRTVHKKHQQELAKLLQQKNMKDVRKGFKDNKFSLSEIKNNIHMLRMNTHGRPPILTRDKEALVVANFELAASAGQGKNILSLAVERNNLTEKANQY